MRSLQKACVEGPLQQDPGSFCASEAQVASGDIESVGSPQPANVRESYPCWGWVVAAAA